MSCSLICIILILRSITGDAKIPRVPYYLVNSIGPLISCKSVSGWNGPSDCRTIWTDVWDLYFAVDRCLNILPIIS